jgi:hypothetical protein
MEITKVTTRILGYNKTNQQLLVAIKTNLCQKNIEEYPPVTVDLINASIPYDVDAAVKDAINASYYAILARHRYESKTLEFFQQLEQQVADKIAEGDKEFTVGVDIPAPPETDLADENSVPTTLESEVKVI